MTKYRRGGRRHLVLSGVATLAVVLGGVSTLTWWGGQRPAPRDPAAGVDLSRPFAQTPADAWAPGLAGLRTPIVSTTGSFSAERVAKAYDEVKALIEHAHLSPAALERGDAQPLLALLSPHARRNIEPVAANRSDPRSAAYVTRIADGYRLLPHEPRVNGYLETAIEESGTLVVRARYAIAYAFAPDRRGTPKNPMEIIAIDRTESDYVLAASPPYTADSAGWSVRQTQSWAYSINCAAWRAGFLAPPFGEPQSPSRDVADGRAPFDPTSPLPVERTCP